MCDAYLQGGTQLPGIRELGHEHDRTTEFPSRVGVGSNRPSQTVLPGEVAGCLIVSSGHAAGIENLDGVDVWSDLNQLGRLPGAFSPPVERMGDADESTLCAKLVDGLPGREPGCDPGAEEHPEKLSTSCHDLLADNHPVRIKLPASQGAFDCVVIGYDNAIDALPGTGRNEVPW